MELRHLKYFVAVAEELHFGRSADRLNISVATLSNQIQALESELSARLLNRKTKSSISLTEAGKRFLIEARATLSQAETAKLVGMRAGRGEIGTLALGYVTAAVTGGILQSAMSAFRTARPNVAIQLHRAETFPQMDAIATGQLDMGITRTTGRYPSGLTGLIIHREPYVLAIPASHKLARKSKITARDIVAEPLITASLQMEVGYWDNLKTVCGTNRPLNIVARAPDMLSVIALAAAGIGISAVSASHQNIHAPGVIYRRIGWGDRQSELALVYRRGETNRLILHFIQTLRKRA